MAPAGHSTACLSGVLTLLIVSGPGFYALQVLSRRSRRLGSVT